MTRPRIAFLLVVAFLVMGLTATLISHLPRQLRGPAIIGAVAGVTVWVVTSGTKRR